MVYLQKDDNAKILARFNKLRIYTGGFYALARS